MITLVDYMGYVDDKGTPIGHPIKVINELFDLLSESNEVQVVVPIKYVKFLSEHVRVYIELKRNIEVYKKKKIGDFVTKALNLFRSFSVEEGIVWYVNINFSLFFWLNLVKPKSKIWITCFEDPFSNKREWQKKLIGRVLKKIKKVVVSSPDLLYVDKKALYVPDYFYVDGLYDELRKKDKEETILCIGTMTEGKNLEELVTIFAQKEETLIIKGDFSSSMNRFHKLIELSDMSQNICVINGKLSYKAYYEEIAKAKFVIFPYDMKPYETRTSGVLLESVFLQCVPIAPEKLLRYNGVAGIAYEEVAKGTSILEKTDVNLIIKENNRYIDRYLKKNVVQQELQKQIQLMD